MRCGRRIGCWLSGSRCSAGYARCMSTGRQVVNDAGGAVHGAMRVVLVMGETRESVSGVLPL